MLLNIAQDKVWMSTSMHMRTIMFGRISRPAGGKRDVVGRAGEVMMAANGNNDCKKRRVLCAPHDIEQVARVAHVTMAAMPAIRFGRSHAWCPALCAVGGTCSF